MGMLKGQKEHERFKEGKSLTRKQAILAQCYDCNSGAWVMEKMARRTVWAIPAFYTSISDERQRGR